MMLFSKKIGNLIGNNMSRLFGIENVSLRRGEIYVDNKKGLDCTYNYNITTPWLLGKTVLENFAKNVNLKI